MPLGTGPGLLNKRPRSPGSTSPSPTLTPPAETSPHMPVSRRSKAKAVAQVKRKKCTAVTEPDEDVSNSDSPPPGQVCKGWFTHLGLRVYPNFHQVSKDDGNISCNKGGTPASI